MLIIWVFSSLKKNIIQHKTFSQENRAGPYPNHYLETGLRPFSLVTSYCQETGTYLLKKRNICHFFVYLQKKGGTVIRNYQWSCWFRGRTENSVWRLWLPAAWNLSGLDLWASQPSSCYSAWWSTHKVKMKDAANMLSFKTKYFCELSQSLKKKPKILIL